MRVFVGLILLLSAVFGQEEKAPLSSEEVAKKAQASIEERYTERYERNVRLNKDNYVARLSMYRGRMQEQYEQTKVPEDPSFLELFNECFGDPKHREVWTAWGTCWELEDELLAEIASKIDEDPNAEDIPVLREELRLIRVREHANRKALLKALGEGPSPSHAAIDQFLKGIEGKPKEEVEKLLGAFFAELIETELERAYERKAEKNRALGKLLGVERGPGKRYKPATKLRALREIECSLADLLPEHSGQAALIEGMLASIREMEWYWRKVESEEIEKLLGSAPAVGIAAQASGILLEIGKFTDWGTAMAKAVLAHTSDQIKEVVRVSEEQEAKRTKDVTPPETDD